MEGSRRKEVSHGKKGSIGLIIFYCTKEGSNSAKSFLSISSVWSFVSSRKEESDIKEGTIVVLKERI